jgi:uncharacterized phiE125 gp8 family phage protein
MMAGEPIVPGAAALGETKAYLRIGHGEEDDLLARLLASAIALCEQFTGQALVVRGFSETLQASGAWTRLRQGPVRAIESVETLTDGVPLLLPADGYALDVDAAGWGWVRLTSRASETRMRVGYSAGIAEEWSGVPEPLRQGVVRLAAHLYTHRDSADDAGPPAVVTALWRPYRRMRLR